MFAVRCGTRCGAKHYGGTVFHLPGTRAPDRGKLACVRFVLKLLGNAIKCANGGVVVWCVVILVILVAGTVDYGL